MKNKSLTVKINNIALSILSPYIAFFIIAMFLICGFFMGVEELWEEFTSSVGIKEINLDSDGYIWPLPGYNNISSNFGNRFHPIKKVNSFHDGIDIPAPQGTSILSPGSGIVKNVYNSSSLGNTVEIESGDYRFVFHHMFSVSVNIDEIIQKGQVIGGVGSTGTLSTGNHLHFSVYDKNILVNPLSIINFSDTFDKNEYENNEITDEDIED